MFIFAPICAAFAMAPAMTRFASASVKVMLITPFSFGKKVKGAAPARQVCSLMAAKAEVSTKAIATKPVVSLSHDQAVWRKGSLGRNGRCGMATLPVMGKGRTPDRR